MRGVDGGRFLVGRRIEDASKAPAGVGDTVERQTGVSADKACRIAQRGVGGVKIGACCLGGEGGLSAKYSASAVAMVRESGRKCLQPQRQSAPAQRRCTSTAWE